MIPHRSTTQQLSISASDTARFSEIFDTYADTASDGSKYMSPVAFAKAIAPSATSSENNWSRITHKGRLYRVPGAAPTPRAASSLSFRVAAGAEDSIDSSKLAALVGDDKAAANYLNSKSHIAYAEFSQLIRSARAERIRRAFANADSKGTGAIPASKLFDIAREFVPLEQDGSIARHLTLLGDSSEAAVVGYPTFLALISLLSDPANVNQAIDDALRRHRIFRSQSTAESHQVSRADFASSTSRFSPLEIDVLFVLASGQSATESVTLANLNQFVGACHKSLLPPLTSDRIQQQMLHPGKPEIPKKAYRSPLMETIFQAYNFAIGAVAGGIGAAVVYPIDLVKTRMQNQRVAVVGEMMYKNSMDCFRKVIRNEGVLGLYRGLGPQLVGVAPEKAIKLTVNDFVRARLTDKETGKIKFAHELFAGSMAGASQVVFTNPLEIVKIRLQVQGELLKESAGTAAPIVRRGAVTIVKELGLLGLYKGASACLLRDVPFSAIYFSCYSHLKTDLFREGERKLSILDLLLAGAIAGMPAAYLTTPADVIKTRLQVVAKKGETVYTGLFDAARKIYKEEGFKAFFKGGPARILRSSPQFGTTLMCYELLHQLIPFPGEEHKIPIDRFARQSSDLTSQTALFHAGNALRLLHDANYKFGSFSQHKQQNKE
ncbi:mitochondrial carrier domain-containing protein [Coemansia spiralis]|nr:mitochondrial carrier domain-containing protein [Coemansia spiralis]